MRMVVWDVPAGSVGLFLGERLLSRHQIVNVTPEAAS